MSQIIHAKTTSDSAMQHEMQHEIGGAGQHPVPAFINSKIHKYLSIPLDFTPFWAYNTIRDKERGLRQ